MEGNAPLLPPGRVDGHLPGRCRFGLQGISFLRHFRPGIFFFHFEIFLSTWPYGGIKNHSDDGNEYQYDEPGKFFDFLFLTFFAQHADQRPHPEVR